MKKVLLLVSILLLAFTIAACGSDKVPDDRTVITYASWNLGSPESKETNMERLMIDAFMELNPDIRVDIIERPKLPGTNDDMSWNEFLAARASTQTLPDVIQSDNIPLYVINNWAYNITELALADPEYANISTDISGVVNYGGKIMALPNAVFYAGYVINKTLYELQGQTAPTLTSTYEQFMTLTKAAADHSSTTNTGVVGLEGIEHIIHWYPAQVNNNFGWFTLTNDGFNLNSDAFGQAVTEYRKLATDSTFVYEAFVSASQEEDSTLSLADAFQFPFVETGTVLAKYHYSWDFGWYQTMMEGEDFTSELDFIGIPVVNGNKKVPIVADFFTLASNTKNPQAAYDFAKWMGFGKEGYLKRIELSNTIEGIAKVNFAPIQIDEDLLDAYFELYPGFPGLRTIIESGSFIVEPVKYLPGYDDARYRGSYNAEFKMGQVITQLLTGGVQYADVRVPLNTQANLLFNQAKQAFDAALATK